MRPPRSPSPVPSHPYRERGSATVLVVGVVVGLVTMMVTGLWLVSVLVAGQQARTAADLAALAGMGRIVEGFDASRACAHARTVAGDNGATLTGCRHELTGSDPWGQIRVGVESAVPGTPWTASARAVAGGATVDRGSAQRSRSRELWPSVGREPGVPAAPPAVVPPPERGRIGPSVPRPPGVVVVVAPVPREEPPRPPGAVV